MPLKSQPLVSVALVTYNHGPYVAQAIESVLAQKTAFPVEVVIGEDDSTDGTRQLCQEFARRHPQQIRLVLRSRDEVVWMDGKPTGRFNFIQTMKDCRGHYIAVLEGDDYWTDPDKLSTQVQFLEENRAYSASAHAVLKVTGEKTAPFSRAIQPQYSLRDLIRMTPIHTSSVVFRRYPFVEDPPKFWWQIKFGDKGLYIQLAEQGPIGFINRVMSHYRYHGRGRYSELNHREIVGGILATYESMITHLSGQNRDYAIHCLANQYLRGARFGLVKRDPAFVMTMLGKFCRHVVRRRNTAG